MPQKVLSPGIPEADLKAALARATASLPEPVRNALAIPTLQPQFPPDPEARAAAKKRGLKSKPKRASKRVLAAYEGQTFDQIVAALLHGFIVTVNEQVPSLARNTPIDAFGDPNNRLDPLQFHGQISVTKSGEACVPRACTSTPFGFSICVPPFPICASGKVTAGLRELQGLATLTIRSLNRTSRMRQIDDRTFAILCAIYFHMDSITAIGDANAQGGPFGIPIPASASARATVNNVLVKALADVTVDFRGPRINHVELNRLHFRYDSLDVGVSGLGPFNGIGDRVANALKPKLEGLLAADGLVAKAVRRALQNIFNRLTGG